MPHPARYVRVNTEEQAREVFSIDAQARILKAYAVIKSLADTVIYIDEGYSAKNMNLRRRQ
ncbi:MAG: recombinase family protein [Oscillospiraceae bacterium]|nr:recombinase family protein [Oscillospiraceae bacterium]